MFQRFGFTTRLAMVMFFVTWPAVIGAFWISQSHWKDAAARSTDRRLAMVADAVSVGVFESAPSITVDRVTDAVETGLREYREGRVEDGSVAQAPAVEDVASVLVPGIESELKKSRSPKDVDRLRAALKEAMSVGDPPTAIALYGATDAERLSLLGAERTFGEALKVSDADRDALASRSTRYESVDRAGVDQRAISKFVTFEGRDYVLHVEIPANDTAVASAKNAESLVVVLLLVSVAVAGALALFVSYAVSRPVEALAGAMNEARKGEFRRTLPVYAEEDQLGNLIRTFNDMIFDLRQQDDSNRRLLEQVEGARRDLERRVAEATLDLRDKNAALLKAQDELVRVQQDVGKLEKLASLGQLSTTLAHELSTPLNVVLGHLELLDMELGRAGLPRDRVRTVTGQVHRLVGILKEMLSMVKLPEPRLATVSLRNLIDDTVRFMVPTAEARRIRIERHLPMEDLWVRADGGQTQQVLLNLLTNAIQASPEGSAVRVEGGRDATRVRIRVRDTGPGIPESEMSRIFEPFFSTKTPDRGMGLGLSISRDIMEKQGGTISARNHPDGGAEFEISFPAADPHHGAGVLE